MRLRTNKGTDMVQGDRFKKLVHDLNGPFATIKIFLNAAKDMEMNEKMHALHEAALKSTKKIADILDAGLTQSGDPYPSKWQEY